MPPSPDKLVEVLNLPLRGKALTPAKWHQIERFLDDWQAEVLAAARRHPAKSYDLGREQVHAFADLLANLTGATSAHGAFGDVGGPSATRREAVAWQQRYLLNELQDALAKYVGRIKDELLYGMRLGVNATTVASRLYNATQDANVNWRAIARTEMVRANAAGRLAACREQGYEQVWAPPHAGACKRCRRLLENRVFLISDVEDVTNFGRPASEWVACIPLHPHCRHCWLPYIPEVYEASMEQFAAMEAAGLTDDDQLDEWFDSSGQLKPEYSHVDFSAAKTFDAAMLAAAVWKVARQPAAARREVLAADDLRVDLYQRALDPDKVLAQMHARRAGTRFPRPRVSRREDGTLWVVDGQHRVESHKLAHPGEPIECDVRDGMTWGDEHDACREAIAKVLDPCITDHGSWIVKVGPEHPLDLLMAADSAPEPGLDPVLFDGLRPRAAVLEQLAASWAHVAGADWRTWSALFLPAHGLAADVVVDWPRLRAAHPEWKALADTDLHMALVVLVRSQLRDAELAPGRPLQLRIDPAQTPRDYAARLSGEDGLRTVWGVDEQTWLVDLPHGVEKTLDADWSMGAHNDVRMRLLGSDEYEASVAKQAAAAANTGVEHWITIHPHGEDDKGQPVLVRNNADGTMSVIGGAGGNLNHLRLDPKRRVAREAGERAKGGSKVEQEVSPEEAAASQAQREQEITSAREAMKAVAEQRAAHQQQMWDYLRDELGVDASELDGKARRKLLAKARANALQTLAYGPLSKRDANESADRGDLGLDKPDAPKPWPGADDAPVTDGEAARDPRPSMAMTDDNAKALLDLFNRDRQLSKVASTHRRVITGEAKASDAMQIDWSENEPPSAADARRAKQVEQLIRSDLARDLQRHADDQLNGDGKGYNTQYRRAFQQGGFDSVDAFAHSILGHGVLSKEASKLLGVAGSAQLVAHQIQQEATAKGKAALDLDKVQTALKRLTDEQEAAVSDRGLSRVKVASERAAEAFAQIAASERGESLYTTTMARSIASEQLQTAKRALGMMVGGLEATSALKVALDRKAGEKIKVGGFATPAAIKELAAKARVKVRDSDITRVGAGNYTLSMEPERLAGLLRKDPEGDVDKRARLRAIREGKLPDDVIESERHGPGMSDVLDRNQARGKMFLREAGSGVLGFDPGVGKTHVAIAAAMEKMAAEPGKHKAIIVAPKNMLSTWANTIASQGAAHSVAVMDGSRKQKELALKPESMADFTVVGYESLPSLKDHVSQSQHSIVIADELQKAKNEAAARSQAVEHLVRTARTNHGDDSHFWGLTGTPIEKDVSDLHAMVRLSQIAKGEDAPDRRTVRTRYGKLGQDEHIARGDKIAQFRKANDEHLFRLSSKDAGNDLGEPKRVAHKVKLTEGHKAALLDRTTKVNEQIAAFQQAKKDGTTGPGMPNFGGRDQLLDALYNHTPEDNALVGEVANAIDDTGTFKHKGGKYTLADGAPDPDTHAGEYEHKHVVFGDSLLSKSLFGIGADGGFDKEGKGGLAGELSKRGVKVFLGHGSLKKGENDANMAAFKAYKGKAVFVTNDTNNAGVSMQFGDNKGAFQHGATHLHHFTRPVNNATIQQREARILRKGAQAGATYHTYSADTPVERRLEETLERELRTQDLAANSEQQVAGSDTLRHHLDEAGTARQSA